MATSSDTRIEELRALLHRVVDVGIDILTNPVQQPSPEPAHAQKREAGRHTPPSAFQSAPPPTSAHGRSASSMSTAKSFFVRRLRQWKSVPVSITWEQWLATPEGATWRYKGGCRTPTRGDVGNVATPTSDVGSHVGPCSAPSQTLPSQKETTEKKREEEDAREACSATSDVGSHVGNAGCSNVGIPTSPYVAAAVDTTESALDVLSKASGGKVSPVASLHTKRALAMLLADLDVVGIKRIDALGATLKDVATVDVWPWSDVAKKGGRISADFLVGKDGHGRMLTEWVEWSRVQRESAAQAAVVAPVAQAPKQASAPPMSHEAYRKRTADVLGNSKFSELREARLLREKEAEKIAAL